MVCVSAPLCYYFGTTTVHEPIAVDDTNDGVVGFPGSSSGIDNDDVSVRYFLCGVGVCPYLEVSVRIGNEADVLQGVFSCFGF